MEQKRFKNATELVVAFLGGETDGFTGSSKALSNLRIKGDFVVHFSTNILERSPEGFILNVTRYSRQTNILQDAMKVALNGMDYQIAVGVPMDYRGHLSGYVSKE